MSLLTIALAVLCGALCVSAGGFAMSRILTPLLRDATAKADAATERLLSAWHAGVSIPGPAGELEADVVQPLDPAVREWLSQWDEMGQIHYGRRAAQMLRQGLSGPEVVVALEQARTRALELS